MLDDGMSRWLAASHEDGATCRDEEGDDWNSQGGAAVTSIALALAVRDLDLLGASPLHTAVGAPLLRT